MEHKKTTEKIKPEMQESHAFQFRNEPEPTSETKSQVHVLKPGCICDTESRGHLFPEGKSPLKLVVDASNGFIPLWAPGTMLRWRFRKRSFSNLVNPDATKNIIRGILGEALLAWGNAAPVKFTEDDDLWDFEIVMKRNNECSAGGCVLASAFFPDSGRHELTLYPMMFNQTKQEQVETLIHEIGHVFGLRHFFAQVSEAKWRSEIFGTHSKFSIMNYGNLSQLTENDRKDLTLLYQSAWAGDLTHINGTPIHFVKPYSALAFVSDNIMHTGFSIAARATHTHNCISIIEDPSAVNTPSEN